MTLSPELRKIAGLPPRMEGSTFESPNGGTSYTGCYPTFLINPKLGLTQNCPWCHYYIPRKTFFAHKHKCFNLRFPNQGQD